MTEGAGVDAGTHEKRPEELTGRSEGKRAGMSHGGRGQDLTSENRSGTNERRRECDLICGSKNKAHGEPLDKPIDK